jgi:hypothetical protein
MNRESASDGPSQSCQSRRMGKTIGGRGRKQNHDIKNIPTLKLLEFSQTLDNGTSARKEAKETQRGSNTMRNLKSVNVEW